MTLVFGCALRRVHSPGRGLGEIKDEKTGKNLLENKVRLLCVKMDEAHGVFQAAEGGLNAPASGVEDLEGGEGEPVIRVSVLPLLVCKRTIRKDIS